MKELNILVCGAGSVGIFFGGKLSNTGANVIYLETTQRISTIKGRELQVHSGKNRIFSFTPNVISDIVEAPPQDIVIISVKAYQTYDVAIQLLPILKPSTIILSLQNGLENEKTLAAILGRNLVMGAVPHFSGYLKDSCTVVQQAPEHVIFGELDHQVSKREQWLSNLFSHADVRHHISRNVQKDIWKNFLWHNVFNTLSVLTRTTYQQVRETGFVERTVEAMLYEGKKVAQAEGVNLLDKDIEKILELEPGYTEIKTSMLKDIETGRGKSLEVESMMGVLLTKAENHGIELPITQTVYNLLNLLVKFS